MQVDPAQIERLVPLIEKGPQTFVAAAFFSISVFLLGLLLQSYKTRVAQERAHKQELKQIFTEERVRAVKQELVAAGFLEFVRMGALVVRQGNPRKLRRVVDDLSPEAPTVATVFKSGENDEG